MPRTYANQVELNYDVAGTGETLVLVHGGWSDRNNWLTVVPELARVLHGRDLRPPRPRPQPARRSRDRAGIRKTTSQR